MIKLLIKWMDTLTKREDVGSFVFVMTVIFAVIVAIISAGMSSDVPSEVSFLEYYTIGKYITFKTFNILFLIGVVLNFSILMLYMRLTEKKLNTKERISSIKQYLAYTVFGYGAINLVLPAIFIVVILGIIIGRTLKAVTMILSGKMDRVVEYLIDKVKV